LQVTIKTYLPAALCALTLVFCYFLIRPYAEIGIIDDWSYIKTAQIFAQSGRIVYNGWSKPMLGWQLVFGAVFVRLFGFSFTAVRLSGVIVDVASAFLLQRTLLRLGIGQWNASLATLTFILSPFYLPFAFTYMTDVFGVFAIVLCIYLCLRALQAEAQSSAAAWISFAALSNAIGGTARQVAWLGLMVMVPSTLWLLRRKPKVLLIGGLFWGVSMGIVAAVMHWYNHQPYSVYEPLMPDAIDLRWVRTLGECVLAGIVTLLILQLPVLLAFIGALPKLNRRAVVLFIAGCVSSVLLAFIVFSMSRHGGRLGHPALYLVKPQNDSGFLAFNWDGILGNSPGIPHYGLLSILVTLLAIIGFIALLTVIFTNLPNRTFSSENAASISWFELGVIIGPFSIAYIALIAVRIESSYINRYLVPLLMVSLVVLTRYYQETVRSKLPIASVVLIFVFGLLAVSITHDEFAEYRGILAATQEIRSTGVPATAIAGGPQYDGWTQIEKAGYINNPKIRIPRGVYVPLPERVFRANCNADFLGATPQINPLYALSFDPGQCSGLAGFAPVSYRRWLALQPTLIYVVKYPA
jgi:hypothetical protein